jgi:hypothetical protein
MENTEYRYVTYTTGGSAGGKQQERRETPEHPTSNIQHPTSMDRKFLIKALVKYDSIM